MCSLARARKMPSPEPIFFLEFFACRGRRKLSGYWKRHIFDKGKAQPLQEQNKEHEQRNETYNKAAIQEIGQVLMQKPYSRYARLGRGGEGGEGH